MVPPGEKPLLVPYRLIDTGEKFEEYCQYPNVYHRKRSAFGTLLGQFLHSITHATTDNNRNLPT